MALFDGRLLSDFPKGIYDLAHKDWQTWLGILCREIPYKRKFEATINPTTVNANDGSTQTFTVTGLDANDIVSVNPPALEAGIIVAWYRVSAANTLQVRFQNVTGGNIDPASGIWLIEATRR